MNDAQNHYTDSLNSIGRAAEDDGIDLWGYLRIIRRRWLLILFMIILTVGLTGFVTLRLTKIYRATATIRIETQAPQVLGRDVEAVDEMGTGSFWSNIEYYETQYKIIESRDVATRVVKKLNLMSDPVFLRVPEEERSKFTPVTTEEAAAVLQGILTVEPIKDSRLVKIHIDHPDPERARLYANTLAQAYVDKNLESMLKSTVDAVDWLSDQLDEAQKKLTESEQQAYAFKRENGILSVSLEERQNILTAQMTAVATKLTEAKARRIELQSKKATIADLVNQSDPMAIPLEAINLNPLIQQLKQDYGKLTQEYSELSERYGAKYPKILEVEAKLNQIKGDISREVKNILHAVDAELEAAKKTEKGLNKTLQGFRNQALKLSEKAVTFGRMERDRSNDERVYQLLLGRSKEADLSKLLRVNNVHILDPALSPQLPIKPRLHINLALSFIIGLVLGLALAIGIEFMDRTVKTQEDVEAFGVSFLGIVPSIDESATSSYQNSYVKGSRKHKRKKKKRAPSGPINFDLFVNDFPKSQVAESLRAIRTNLLFMSADKPAKKILVTSPSPQEGKTTVATNLAIAMAQAGARILLVDTDMRRPRVHHAFKVRPKKGISTMVLGESELGESVFDSDIENLDVLMCGPTPPNPAELIHTESFHKVVDLLSGEYDHVIFDSPPIAVVTDAAILSKMVDGTVLIVKSLKTTRDAVKHAVGVLKDINAKILGVVLNDLDLTNRKYGQHYYYYYYKKYGYYYHEETEEENLERESIPPKSKNEPSLHA